MGTEAGGRPVPGRDGSYAGRVRGSKRVASRSGTALFRPPGLRPGTAGCPETPASPFVLSRYDSNREAGASMSQPREGRKTFFHTVNKRTFCGAGSQEQRVAASGAKRKASRKRGRARALIQVSGRAGLWLPISRPAESLLADPARCRVRSPELPVSLPPWVASPERCDSFREADGIIARPSDGDNPFVHTVHK